jgi:hypothetical protein
MPAPIALFCFRRPHHLARTLEALANNVGAASHDLVAFQDGPRGEADVEGVRSVRRLLDEWAGRGIFRSFSIVARTVNCGLAEAITTGVNRMLADGERTIVVEDDLVTSPYFLAFCNDGLELYADHQQVASVHGYFYPLPDPLPTTFFLRGAECWGWATWRRAWRQFRPDGRILLSELRRRGLVGDFDLDGAYPFTRMLLDQVRGHNQSWAIRWRASAWLAGMHTLFPGRSLVDNIGHDGGGTHAQAYESAFSHPVTQLPVAVEQTPVAEDPAVRRALSAYLDGIMRPKSLLGRARRIRSQLEDRWLPV